MLIGLISDTHGLLRAEALAALTGSDLILHGGDIGGAAILDQLAELAPVLAVRGNNDRDAWAETLPEFRLLDLAGVRVLLLHDRKQLQHDLTAEGIAVVVSGHSHRPRVDREGGVLFVNPGSAGPRRFQLPISVARLQLVAGQVEVELLPLG